MSYGFLFTFYVSVFFFYFVLDVNVKSNKNKSLTSVHQTQNKKKIAHLPLQWSGYSARFIGVSKLFCGVKTTKSKPYHFFRDENANKWFGMQKLDYFCPTCFALVATWYTSMRVQVFFFVWKEKLIRMDWHFGSLLENFLPAHYMTCKQTFRAWFDDLCKTIWTRRKKIYYVFQLSPHQ